MQPSSLFALPEMHSAMNAAKSCSLMGLQDAR